MEPNNIDPSTITPEILGNLLSNIFRPETEVIRQSTELLKKYFDHPICLTSLFTHMTSNPDSKVRLLAAICLRKKLSTHWHKQDEAFKVSSKTALLTAFFTETVPKVKENISYVIGALALILVPENTWPEIFTFVVEKCQSSDGNELSQGVILLHAICDALKSAIEPYTGSIIEIINRLIVVQNPQIQILVVKTINILLLSDINIDILEKVAMLIPQMINTVIMLQDNNTLLHDIFDNLSDLIDLPKVLVPHLSMLISTALDIASNKGNNNELRKVAIMFIQCIVGTKSKIVKKNKEMLSKILEGVFNLAKESEVGYEEDEETPVDAALDLLEQYSFRIPNKIIYPFIINGCETYLKSEDPLSRRAALLILGTVSKGVEEAIKKNLETVLNVVLQCSADPVVEVQEACIIALCYFADNLMPEFNKYHAKVLPLLLTEIGSKPEKVRMRVFYALEAFCGNLEEKDIIPYLKPLLQTLVLYLDDPKMYTMSLILREIKRNAMMTLIGVITAAQKQISPYFEDLIPKLTSYLIEPSTLFNN